MARPTRLLLPGAWYHVVTRGTERRAIFTCDEDRVHFLSLLAAFVDRHRIRLHAYVLMDNHIHLVLSTPEANLPMAMQWLKTSYSMWFNRRHDRVGPLFQGRYRAQVFEGTAEAWPITRYVHLNPVRVARLELAKADRSRNAMGGEFVPPELVRERLRALRTYRWSSYPCYSGVRPTPEWLALRDVLNIRGGASAAMDSRVRAYRAYVLEALGVREPESPIRNAAGGLLLGSAEWVTRMRAKLAGDPREQPAYRAARPRPDWPQIRKAVERVRGGRWGDFADRHGDTGRDLALFLLRHDGGLSLREASECVGIAHYQTAAQALQRFAKRLEHDTRLQLDLRNARNCIKIKT